LKCLALKAPNDPSPLFDRKAVSDPGGRTSARENHLSS
jgi:hypothetical protein